MSLMVVNLRAIYTFKNKLQKLNLVIDAVFNWCILVIEGDKNMFTDQATKALTALANLITENEQTFRDMDIMRYLDDALLDGQFAIEQSEAVCK